MYFSSAHCAYRLGGFGTLPSSANHSDSSGVARSLALSFSRVAAARRIPVLPDVLQRNSGFLARARHARGNDRKIRPSGRAVSLSCAGVNSVVPRKYLYTAKLSLSESVIFLISSRCPFPMPLPVCPGRGQARLAHAGEGSSHTDVVLPPSRRLCPS